jgi:hypothetical protein
LRLSEVESPVAAVPSLEITLRALERTHAKRARPCPHEVAAMRQRLTLVALLAFLTAGPADAQISSEGTVRGVVRDAGGGVLPGVTLTAVSPTVPGTHVSVSESDGQYRLLNLSPGVFDVVAELAGFTKYVQQGVEVRAGLNLTLDIVLTLASV